MRKHTGPVVGIFLLMMFCVSLWAQQKKGAKLPEKTSNKSTGKAAFIPLVTVGHSEYSNGPIKVALFDTLLKQGLHSKDQEGNPLTVIGFNFSYYERVVYEDSSGDLHMMVDFSKEYCPGSTITENVAASIYDRIKGGDTVLMDRILLTKNRHGQKADTFLGKSIKAVIIK